MGSDAVTVSKELELTLTSRRRNEHERVPLVGFPAYTVDTNIKKLLDKGFDVAVTREGGEVEIIESDKKEPAYVDTSEIRRKLENNGIVNGQIVDPEKLDADPFVQQVMADAEAVSNDREQPDGEVKLRSIVIDLRPDDVIVADYIGRTIQIDYRDYQIEDVSERGEVSMRDLTFERDNGYPIFRNEKAGFVREMIALQQKRSDDELTPSWEQTPRVKKQTFDLHPDIPMSQRHTFDLAANEVEAVGKKDRFRRNIMAIRTLKTCREENRFATPEEQIILSKYVGWGGIPEAFDQDDQTWSLEFIISEIEAKVLSMYARGMSQRDIAETIEDIYGFEISHETISEITDCVLEELNDWQNRPLKKIYTFLFVDCMYVTIRKEYESKSYAVYTILGYDTNGEKDILGLWLNESESKHTWMQIFDELKSRGVEDVLFISMDGVSGLEEGAKAIFKDVVVQRCMVHLIRNSIKYVPSKDYKKFTQSLKKVYGAPSLNACKKAFEQFCQEWSQFPGAVDVWKRNFSHVEQLFDYGSAVRRVMYTTNAVESINSSFRKVTKKGAFPSENALLKVLYLRITELYKKWNGSKVQNWAMVRNQLVTNDKIKARIEKYEHMI